VVEKLEFATTHAESWLLIILNEFFLRVYIGRNRERLGGQSLTTSDNRLGGLLFIGERVGRNPFWIVEK
jgi:hypothetical protein